MLHMTTTRKRVLNKSSILAKIEYTLCTFTVSICLTVHVCKYGRIRLSNLHISFFKFDILLFIDYKIILLRLVQILRLENDIAKLNFNFNYNCN